MPILTITLLYPYHLYHPYLTYPNLHFSQNTLPEVPSAIPAPPHLQPLLLPLPGHLRHHAQPQGMPGLDEGSHLQAFLLPPRRLCLCSRDCTPSDQEEDPLGVGGCAGA